MSKAEISKAAKTLSKLGASKGGIARAEKMTPEQRSEIAKIAAAKRWGVPEVLCAGELRIGDIVIPCAVLDNEQRQRVLSENGITVALLGSRSGASKRLKKAGQARGAPLPIFLAPKNLKAFISNDLLDGLLHPLEYRVGSHVAQGFPAEFLPQICDVWLRAREEGAIQNQQLEKCKKAEILMRGLAHVGIIALVDEATGYQNLRARRALEEILEAFISDKLLKWAKRFPDNFYEEIFRLRRWHYSEDSIKKRPSIVGKYTNDIVYARLGPCILKELQRLNPPDEKGRRKDKHHKWLTEDVGHQALKEHLVGVIALMKASPNWPTFQRLLHRAYPAYNEQLDLIYEEIDEEMKADYATIG